MGTMASLAKNHDLGMGLKRMLDRYERTRRVQTVDFRRLLNDGTIPNDYTHQIHPYPAKLLAHIPHFLLANELFSKCGDTILDPFCGSGTVLLESQLAGRKAFGADSNPLARLISEVKTHPIDHETLEHELSNLVLRVPQEASLPLPDVVNLTHWYAPSTVKELLCVKEAVESISSRPVKRFFQVCLSACARNVSFADPRLSVPVRLKISNLGRGQYHSDPKIEEAVKKRRLFRLSRG